MQGKRTKFKADFKAKVALEALKADKSTAELAQIYGVHPTQITQWKKQLLDSAASLFEGRQTKAVNVDVDELYKKIGKLEMERDFLVVTARGEWSSELRRQMIDPALELSVSDQCRLLSLPRSTYYYERAAEESAENLALMEAIDRIYLAHPENGSRHDGEGLEASGRLRQSQTGPASDAAHGDQKPMPATENDHAQQGSPGLSLPVAQRPRRSTQPRVGGRHHLRPVQKRIPLLRRDHGLALAKGVDLATLEHDDRRLLRGGAQRSARALWHARDFQYRSRVSSRARTSRRS